MDQQRQAEVTMRSHDQTSTKRLADSLIKTIADALSQSDDYLRSVVSIER